MPTYHGLEIGVVGVHASHVILHILHQTNHLNLLMHKLLTNAS